MNKVMDLLNKLALMAVPLLKKTESEVGIKETKEALIAGNEIALFIAERFKDGVGVDDFTAIWDKLRNDEEFKAKLSAGWDKYKLISSEAKDIDLGEGIELGMLQLNYIPTFLEVFKKEEK